MLEAMKVLRSTKTRMSTKNKKKTKISKSWECATLVWYQFIVILSTTDTNMTQESCLHLLHVSHLASY